LVGAEVVEHCEYTLTKQPESIRNTSKFFFIESGIKLIILV
jgi:hypothetical protein